MELCRSSVLDNKNSRVYGYPLTYKQQIWCHYILPGTCFLVGYVINLSLDLSVGLELINEHKTKYGYLTILLLYLPAIICFLQQLFKPPSKTDVNHIIKWLCKETGILIMFPFRVLKCLGMQLFWILELLKDKEDREEALQGIENSFDEVAETYLFLQIFIQNIPQALLQFHLITIGTSGYDDTDVTQAFCSITSLAMAAQGITRLHRYESQRIGGRTTIWKQSLQSSTLQSQQIQDIPLQDPLIQNPDLTEGLRLPTRNPRIKALEEDNPVGKLVLFLFWWMILFGRVLTIVTSLQFFPRITILILLVHALIMFIYYIFYTTKMYKRIFLAFSSLFFIVEVGLQIKKIAYLYFVFIVSLLAEDIGMSLLWYIWGNWQYISGDGWWYNYIIYVDINTHFISLIFFTIYLSFFKAKVKYLPSNQRTSASLRSSTNVVVTPLTTL